MERTWRRVSLGLSGDSLILPVSREKAACCEVRDLMIRSLDNVVDSIMGAIEVEKPTVQKRKEPDTSTLVPQH